MADHVAGSRVGGIEVIFEGGPQGRVPEPDCRERERSVSTSPHVQPSDDPEILGKLAARALELTRDAALIGLGSGRAASAFIRASVAQRVSARELSTVDSSTPLTTTSTSMPAAARVRRRAGLADASTSRVGFVTGSG